MKTYALSRAIAIVFILLLALVSCTTPSVPETGIPEPTLPPTDVPPTAPDPTLPPSEVPTIAPEPSPEPIIELGEVIFDGTVCNATIPSELPPGKYSMVLRNLTEEDVNIWTERITEGKTYQDVLDLQDKPGDWVPEPDWTADTIELGGAKYTSDGGEVHTYKFVIESEYFVGVWIYGTPDAPMRVWFCAPFLVREAPSE